MDVIPKVAISKRRHNFTPFQMTCKEFNIIDNPGLKRVCGGKCITGDGIYNLCVSTSCFFMPFMVHQTPSPERRTSVCICIHQWLKAVVSYCPVEEASTGQGTYRSLTAEKVAENWDKISDFSNSSPFFMGGEQTGKFFKLATK